MKQPWQRSASLFMGDEDTRDNEGMLKACFLGFRQPYNEILQHMHERHRVIASGAGGNELLVLEHQPVITITRQHMDRSIKTSQQSIRNDGIDLTIADRGGDATFHGEGQLVGYPIIRLNNASWRLKNGMVDIERYIRVLEQSLLGSIQRLGFTKAFTIPGFTGVWFRCDASTVSLKKLIAIGVGIKDGVTKHGFALNVDIDHQRFCKHMVPCGLKDRGVTTLKEIAEREGIIMPSWPHIMQVIASDLAINLNLELRWRKQV